MFRLGRSTILVIALLTLNTEVVEAGHLQQAEQQCERMLVDPLATPYGRARLTNELEHYHRSQIPKLIAFWNSRMDEAFTVGREDGTKKIHVGPQGFDFTVRHIDYDDQSYELGFMERVEYPAGYVSMKSFGPFENTPYSRYFDIPIQGVIVEMSFHSAALFAIYSHYSDEIPLELRKMVREVESSLPTKPQKIVVVESGVDGHLGAGHVFGFLRKFDATKDQAPLERILARMKKRTLALNKRRMEGRRVIELGKYYLERNLSATLKLAVKAELLYWQLKEVESEPEDTYFFAHTGRKAHTLAYEREYGFRLTASEDNAGLSEGESILEVDRNTLLANLRSHLSEIEKLHVIPERKDHPSIEWGCPAPYSYARIRHLQATHPSLYLPPSERPGLCGEFP